MIIFLGFFLLRFYPGTLINRVIFIFILYIGILSLLTSNINLSVYGYMKFFIATLMFPLGYYFFNNHEKLLQLTKIYGWVLLLFMLNILISNIFELGTSDYLEEFFYFGAGRVNITKSTLIILFTGPILLYSKNFRYKRIFGIFLVIAVLVTIIGIKRSVLISALLAIIIFGFTSKQKAIFLRGLIGMAFILIVTFSIIPESSEILFHRYEARSEELEFTEETVDREGRYNETLMVLEAWVNGSLSHKLFGSEMFNDLYFFKQTRMLHTDYMVVLAGAGLVGLIFWFLIYYLMIREKERYWKLLKHDERFFYYRPVFYSILAGQMLMSISGTIQGIDLRSFILLYLGALIGSMRGEVIIKFKEIKTINESG